MIRKTNEKNEWKNEMHTFKYDTVRVHTTAREADHYTTVLSRNLVQYFATLSHKVLMPLWINMDFTFKDIIL